jgi:MarR family 2-MHQ and catechol resistance regulon transcriptional repressor
MTERDADGKALDLRLLRVMRNMAKAMFESLERDIDSYASIRKPSKFSSFYTIKVRIQSRK